MQINVMVLDSVEIKVLDHGYVKFINAMGTDEGIIEAARMSTGRGFEGWEGREFCRNCDATKTESADSETCTQSNSGHHLWEVIKGDFSLLDFLWRNKHATPFEMCELVIEVQAPLFVFREWHRHRTQSYNEFSARYSAMPNVHYVPELERFRPKVSANKQEGSVGTFEEVDRQLFPAQVEAEQDHIYESYEDMLQAGVPKEVARINTPVSRYSKMRAKANLRNWLGFLNLRMRPNAQWEIRQYANAVAEFVKKLWPKTWSLFEEYDLYGASFSRSELAILRSQLMGTLLSSKAGVLHDQVATLPESRSKEFLEKISKGGLEILS